MFFVPFLIVFFFGWLIGNRFRFLKVGIYLIGLGILLGYGIFRVSSDYSITAYWSFSSRTLTVLLLPALLVAAVVVKIRKPQITRLGINLFATACLLLTAFNMFDLRDWSRLKSEMESVLYGVNSAVLIPIEETGIDDSQLRHIRHSWNNPALSLVWSYPCVKHLITNGARFDGYQVFNPENEIRLKRYLEFAEGFKSIDPDVSVCE
jgi:asparagine N-glycosylation enzyme membrane subunit Stt3